MLFSKQVRAEFIVGQKGVAPARMAAAGTASATRNKRVLSHPAPQGEAETLLLLCADWLWETDSRQRISWLSGSFIERTGVAPSQLLGNSRLATLHGDFSPEAERHKAELSARKPFRDFVQPFVCGDRQLHLVSLTGVPRFDAERAFLGYRGTARLLASSAPVPLAVNAANLAGDVVARLRVPIFVKDASLRFLLANQAFADQFGVRSEAMIGRRLADFASPRLAHQIESAESAVLLTGLPCARALTLPAGSDAQRWTLRQWRLQRDGQPLIVGCMAEAAQGQGAANKSEINHPQPSDLDGARIIIVHRDPAAGADVSQRMAGRGLDACAAGNATEALGVIKTAAALGRPVDCALLDDRLPGVEIARIIRTGNSLNKMPIVLVGAQEQPDELLDAVSATIREHRSCHAAPPNAARPSGL